MIYSKIKDMCKVRGISVTQLEQKAGLGNGAISKWNTVSPSIKNLAKVAEVLECSVDELIKGVYEAVEPEEVVRQNLECYNATMTEQLHF